MEEIKRNPCGMLAPVFAAVLLLLFSSPQNISAQQQLSTFTIPGWTPGTTPIFTDSNSNVVSLSYGDNLNTTVSFAGYPNDGLGTDFDNIAYMNFSYSYTIYLTPFGQTFSTAASIPLATHTIGAYQSCSSGITPPWTISYDAQPTVDTNKLDMNIADAISDCIPTGNYQVDIIFNNYTVNSVGPNPPAIVLEWLGYPNNNIARGLSTLTAPSSANNNGEALNPATSYILSQIAFVKVARPQSCPPVNLILPRTIETFAARSSATVVASYPGQCLQNTFTYLWSNGETNATAVNLSRGTYTVTVTAPCGNIATASVTISYITDPDIAAVMMPVQVETMNYKANATEPDNKTYKNSTDNNAQANTTLETHFNLYPNPATHNITFDLTTAVNTTYSIRILDILGNEVMVPATDASMQEGNRKINIDVDALTPGAYLYELVSDRTYRGKFIKQ